MLRGALVWAALLAAAAVCNELPQLTINFYDNAPCRLLRQLVKPYAKANVTVLCPDFTEWHSSIVDAFKKGDGPDLAVYDSQWLGELVGGSYLEDVTDLLQNYMSLYFKLEDFGSWPQGSNRYYGFGIVGDNFMLVLRKDIFDKYNISYRFPDGWARMLEVARFLKYNTSENFDFGFAAPWCGNYSECYDEMACSLTQAFYNFGGDVWDASTYRIEGILDSPYNEKAMTCCRNLIQTCEPKGCADMSYDALIHALCYGEAPFGMIWASFGPEFTNNATCPMQGKLRFISVPKGSKATAVMGGQGLGINRQSHELEAAKELFQWLLLEDTQYEWSKLGGMTTMSTVMQDYEFIEMTPYNIVYVANFGITSDFWRLPEYMELMDTHMTIIHKGMTGELSPKEALNQAAETEQGIVDRNHPCGPVDCKHHHFPLWASVLIPVLSIFGLFALLFVAFIIGAIVSMTVLRKKYIQEGINLHRTVIFGRRAHS
eukprot:TRINITY_DN17546_c0_g1_i1.p1 TRINITY_DN17546_c0_g1~~TRINITY_DN17546_c0_g1_i1.p1  ORF type:complete len:494 (+),score=94.10 TRINITY_DN17546_c0_g1_i1:22-1482(+)